MKLANSQLRKIIQEEIETIIKERFETEEPIKQLDLYGKEEISLSDLRALLTKTQKQQEEYKKEHDGKANPELTTKLRRINFAIRSRTGWGEVDN